MRAFPIAPDGIYNLMASSPRGMSLYLAGGDRWMPDGKRREGPYGSIRRRNIRRTAASPLISV